MQPPCALRKDSTGAFNRDFLANTGNYASMLYRTTTAWRKKYSISWWVFLLILGLRDVFLGYG